MSQFNTKAQDNSNTPIKRRKVSDAVDKVKMLQDEIDKLKKEALECSQNNEKIKAKIVGAELVKLNDEREHERAREKMNETKMKVLEAQKKWSGVDKELEENRKALKELKEYKNQLITEVEGLRSSAKKKQAIINEKRTQVLLLKKRRAAMMIMLNKQKESYQHQIQKFQLMRDKSSEQ